ncbi:hypothetical protein LAD77_01810 [Klebsiella pneumoniae]|nr:hypothetical protein [Klebsiella pneumoniae]
MSLNTLAGAIELRSRLATRPSFGVQPVLVDNERPAADGATEGNLASPTPGAASA